MANVNKPLGLRPVATQGNGTYVGAIETFYVPSTDSGAIGIGDPVKLAGGVNSEGYPIAIRGTVGGNVVGVCVGIKLYPQDLTLTYRKASTAMYILVDTDPNTIYEIQEDSVGGAVAIADGTKNASIILGTVDTTTGNGKTMLDSSTVAATNTLDLLMLHPSPAPDNSFPLAYAKWWVKLNLHQYGTAARVGV